MNEWLRFAGTLAVLVLAAVAVAATYATGEELTKSITAIDPSWRDTFKFFLLGIAGVSVVLLEAIGTIAAIVLIWRGYR